jgi:hypothetical protein
MVIFQLDVVHNWPNKLFQKSMDEKSSTLSHPEKSIVILYYKMVLAAFRG